MPVTAQHVPLQTAKDWAKRLAKFTKEDPSTEAWPLARAQLAIAKVLGFDHWHELNATLGSSEAPRGVVLPLPTGPQPASLSLPSPSASALEWRKLWPRLALGGDAQVVVQVRAAKVQVFQRKLGQVVAVSEARALSECVEGIATIGGASYHPQLRSMLGQLLSDGEIPHGFISHGNMELDERYEVAGSFQALPIYPGGWDIVLRFRPTFSTPSLGSLGLSPAHLQQLYQAIQHPGLVVVAGRAAEQLKLALCGANEAATGKESVLINGPLTDEASLQAALGMARFHAVFASLAASPAEAEQSLARWGLSGEERGNACALLSAQHLPLLCAHCSVPQVGKAGRVRGAGCAECQQSGTDGVALVVGLAVFHQGKLAPVFSPRAHAHKLVAQGLVDPEALAELG